MGMHRSMILLGACVAAALGLSGCVVRGSASAGGSGSATSGSAPGAGAGGSLSMDVRVGFFFGQDVRGYQSVVYVLDMSGSMSEQTGTVGQQMGNRMAARGAGRLAGGFFGGRAGARVQRRILDRKKKVEIVKRHLIASLRGLPQNGQFNLILFSDGVQKLAPGMIAANGMNVVMVSAFVRRLEEGGSTNMIQALDAAFYTPAQHIILLTDGLPTSSTPDDIISLARQHAGEGRTISTVGVGADQAYDFLAELARENGGTFTSYE